MEDLRLSKALAALERTPLNDHDMENLQTVVLFALELIADDRSDELLDALQALYPAEWEAVKQKS